MPWNCISARTKWTTGRPTESTGWAKVGRPRNKDIFHLRPESPTERSSAANQRRTKVDTSPLFDQHIPGHVIENSLYCSILYAPGEWCSYLWRPDSAIFNASRCGRSKAMAFPLGRCIDTSAGRQRARKSSGPRVIQAVRQCDFRRLAKDGKESAQATRVLGYGWVVFSIERPLHGSDDDLQQERGLRSSFCGHVCCVRVYPKAIRFHQRFPSCFSG